MSKGIDSFIVYVDLETTKNIVSQLQSSPIVKSIFLLVKDESLPDIEGCKKITISNLSSSETYKKICESLTSDYAMIQLKPNNITFGFLAISRMWNAASNTQASLLYSDRWSVKNGETLASPTMDYYDGSVRDDFDLGSVIMVSKAMLSDYFLHNPDADHQFAGRFAFQLYLLRHRSQHPLLHLREYLYTEEELDLRNSGEKQFDYVDPRNRSAQIEYEKVCTQHLKQIGAYIDPANIVDIDVTKQQFDVEASVIIPVRNRAKTIADAVRSALSQEAEFPFNVIVVDNHSTDGTTDIVAELAKQDNRVIHIIPNRNDLGIGGCWSMAFTDERCGRFAVQLDSDDLYSGTDTLKRIVDKFYAEKCGMVIGSYRMCNFQLETLPPGIIDHKEWTDSNGRNNALRINGLGAPRAFFTPMLRSIGMPNTSYGEDYAVGLAFSRQYKIGRIFEELYLCRRWEGNSDAALSPEKVVKNNEYKDSLRTMEIIDRQLLNAHLNRRISSSDADEMFHQQLDQWKDAADRYAQLANVSTTSFAVHEARLAAQFNPARIVSTGAKIDSATIGKRPCFLCDANRPKQQISIPFLGKYQLLVNPFPILPQHYTIPMRQHLPQAIKNNYEDMMEMVQMLYDSFVFYNGPYCGASAPDHMHFQAGSRGIVPLERDWDNIYKPKSSLILPACACQNDLSDTEGIFSLNGYVCPGFVVIASTAKVSKLLFDKLYDALIVPEGHTEPMMNILAWTETKCDGQQRLISIILPRAKHRPDAYFAEGADNVMVSPGAIDMGGLIITPREEDFRKMTPELASCLIAECGISSAEESEITKKMLEC